jgi:hypothetical protein
MPYGRLLNNDTHRCETLPDFPHPVVLLQGSESRGNRFIERRGSDLDGVLNVLNIRFVALLLRSLPVPPKRKACKLVL